MSDNIILEKVTFYKLDDEGEVLLDDKGNERILGYAKAPMKNI
jgi:hypothetical protein